jgi:hypothetical protein
MLELCVCIQPFVDIPAKPHPVHLLDKSQLVFAGATSSASRRLRYHKVMSDSCRGDNTMIDSHGEAHNYAERVHAR